MMLINSSTGNLMIVLAAMLLIQSIEGFMIAFSCGTTVDLDWIFYCGFTFPPQVDYDQAPSKTFFSPLTFATYVDFIKDLAMNASAYIPKNRDNLNFYQLLWHLHSCPYAVESLKNHLPSSNCNPSNSGSAAASTLQKSPESLHTPKTINPITKSTDNVPKVNNTFDIEKYISFWKRFRYVYPMTTVESFDFHKELGSGTFGTCHWTLAKIDYRPSISLSISLPYNIAFKKIRELSPIQLNDCVHGSALDLNELHLSIFNKLNECQYIHHQIGVAVNEFVTGSTEYFAGYVAEVATLGSLNAFMLKHYILSGHVFILEKMLDVARAIDFMHKNEIMHADIVPRNILVFYLGNGEIAFKLADLGTSCRYELCKSPQIFEDWEEHEDHYKETYPKELFFPESFPHHCSQMDWYMFGCTLKKTVEFLKEDIPYAFETVGHLIVALTEDEYVELVDTFELVMYSLQHEIKAMREEVEPQEFSFYLKAEQHQ